MKFLILSMLCILIPFHRSEALDGNFHLGHLLEFGRPRSTFCGLFYERAPQDDITVKNQLFLRDHLNKANAQTEYRQDQFQAGPRYKLVPLDSTFVSVYIPNYYDSGHAFMILDDLKFGGSYFLSEFNMSEFNKLLRLQNIRKPYDYILIAQLSLILLNMKVDINFIDSFNDYFRVIKTEGFYCPDNKYDELVQLCTNKIEAARIDTLADGVNVTFYATDPGWYDIKKYMVHFLGDSISQVDSAIVIESRQIIDILNNK